MAGIAVLALALTLLLGANTDEGRATTAELTAVALPTTTTTTTTTVAPDSDEETEVIDVSQFGTEQPSGLIDSILWEYLTQAGADPQRAVCTGSIPLERFSQKQLLDSGLAEFSGASLAPVIEAGLDCGLDQVTIDAAVGEAPDHDGGGHRGRYNNGGHRNGGHSSNTRAHHRAG